MSFSELEKLSPANYYYDVRSQLKDHVYGRSRVAFREGDAARDALKTPGQVRARQKQIREKFVALLGGLPSSDTSLNPRITGRISAEGFQIEKVIFEARPGHFVTANLYLPEGIDTPRGAALFLCGHHENAKHQPEYQIVCQHLVRTGLIVLAQDPVGQGERFSYWDAQSQRSAVRPGTGEHDTAGAQCLPLGDAIARYFLHDAMRGIDYLISRPEVDPDRIGVVGNSGGGTQTSLVMLADPRIAAAAPATFIMSRETYMDAGGAQDAEQIWPGFTDCGFDHEDILLAMAPKPVRVLAVTSDFFPIEGTRRTMQRCQRIWRLFGQEQNCDLVEDVSSHSFTPKLAQSAAAFFAHHFGTEAHRQEGAIEAFEPHQLWCTQSGQVRGEVPGARFVYDANGERLHDLELERGEFTAEARLSALSWIRTRTEKGRSRPDLNPRHYYSGVVDDLKAEAAFWWSQLGIIGHGLLFRSGQSPRDAGLPVSLGVWTGGVTELQAHAEWIRNTCASGRAALVLDVSGTGALAPHPINATPPQALYGTIHKLTTDLIWLDDSMVALRTFDVIRALDMIEQWPGLDAGDIHVYASGHHGLYGRLAALIDPRIGSIEIADGLRSYTEWIRSWEYDANDIYSVILPGALHHFDFPEMENRGPNSRA